MKQNLLLILALLCIIGVNAQTADKAEAMRLVAKNATAIGLSNDALQNVIVSDSYFDKTSGARMVYLQQAYKNIPVYNQLLSLAFKNETLVSKAGTFITSLEKKVNTKDAVASLPPAMALQNALADRKLIPTKTPSNIVHDAARGFYEFGDMGISRENITVQIIWVPIEDGRKVQLAWQVYLIPNNSSDYWMIRVDANNGRILGMDNYTVYCNWEDPANKFPTKKTNTTQGSYPMFDFMATRNNDLPLTNSPFVVNSSSYRVIPFPAESPSHPGGAHALVANPWSAAPGNATSLKWNNDGTTDYNITRGNNVWAQEDRNNNNGTGVAPTATSVPDPLIFDFTPNYTVTPTQTTPNPNQQFNTTNLFYWNNIAHDITYLYGFDEVGGNFQASNQGRGGAGGDWVNADAQDGGGTNNANFSTPPDGQSGRMQMYLWSGSPQKDGDVDNGVIVHEFGHGISNRLTGGPSQAGCLSNAEQMGEGWSDYYCLMYTQDWANSNLNTGFSSPRGIGTYVIGQTPNGSGIRNQKYCTNFAVNNQVYAASISSESHNRGEIWCATLWDMTWNIINQVGSITPSMYSANGVGGNVIALKLVTEAMKLQPCSPGFIDGRDAIIQADQLLYGGAHECAIREAFRRRGMGAFASQGSSGSVTDQIADYTAGGVTFSFNQNGTTQVPEGGFITYTHVVTTSGCSAISNFLITDTLPTNVTWVSGGTYNATNRVVSFTVNQGAGLAENYSFTVQVNAGAYYPTVTLFEDNVTGPAIPATWTTNSTTSTNWVVSNSRSHSASESYYSFELDVTSDQKLFSTTAIALGATPPPLSFWHWYSTESTYDGGVLEISTDGGTVWTDLGPHIIKNGYTGTMDATTIIPGRRAWTGSSNNKFIKTKVDLSSYANQSIKIRFRFTSDVGTQLEGWYVDDIAIKDQAVVEMQANYFSSNNIRVGSADTITIITPPVTCNGLTVNAQPQNVNACEGANAVFTANIDGTTPALQWQISTDGGANYTDMPGQINPTLTINNVTAGMNNYRYRLTATNTCPSSVFSDAAILTVSNPASITTQPVNFTICAGGNASFTVAASGSNNTFQWQVSIDGGNTFTDVIGATNATLDLATVTAAMNNNQYHVVITSCSPNPITSDNVTLTVNSPAAIVTDPLNITACAGTDAVFTSVASGTNVSYQWQVSTNGGATFTDIPGANGASLTLTGVTSGLDNNQYHVVVTNICGTNATSANATLTISNTASITTQPASVIGCSGDPVTFTATASGTAYQWQVSTNGGVSFTDIPGATTTTLDLASVTSSMNGNQYHLVVSTCGPSSLISDNVTLTVNTHITIDTQPGNDAVCDGSNASFSVTASGTAPNYQWEVSTDGGISFNPVPGATAATLNLTGVTTAMDGNIYRVVVSNTCTVNFTSNNAVLSVSNITVISTPPANQTACEGTDVTFNTTATGSGLTYQWQISTNGGTSFSDIPGATSSSLPLVGITSAMNNYQYRVIVSGCNSITSTAGTLIVNPLPVVSISVSPYVSLTTGLSTTLTATSTPASNVFSWYLNNNIIASATTGTLVVNYPDTGNYKATVTDANGCTNESNVIAIHDSLVNIAFIYPNPNNGHFFVRFKGTSFNGQPRIITMYDAKGARVYQSNHAANISYQEMEVHAEHLSTGAYMLVLSDAAGNVLRTGKVIIQTHD